MVAIVSGNSLGLKNTSAGVLGDDGVFGKASLGNADEQSYVNVANGNLVLQDQDDYLASHGLDVALTRTYNSQALLNPGSSMQQWQNGMERSVGAMTGTANTNGSTVTRVGADGSRTVFTYDSARAAYISTDGGGAYQSITYDSASASYTWKLDPANALSDSEKYDALMGGRIVSASSLGGLNGAGNTVQVNLTYAYTSLGKLDTITDESGEVTKFHYDTAGNLASIGVQTNGSTGAELVRVHYAYDTLNRLTSVSIDLHPEATQAGSTQVQNYTTSYTYDGVSSRIASVTQQDGTKLQFEYAQSSPGVYKVAAFTDGQNRRTTFSYANGETTVTDAKGNVARYRYDGQGEYLSSSQTAPGGADAAVGHTFTYDGAGNIASMNDNNGVTTYQYDSQGSITRQVNPDGSVITRTYDPVMHRLATESITDNVEILSNGSFTNGMDSWETDQSAGASPPYAGANGGVFFENPTANNVYPADPEDESLAVQGMVRNRFKTTPGETYTITVNPSLGHYDYLERNDPPRSDSIYVNVMGDGNETEAIADGYPYDDYIPTPPITITFVADSERAFVTIDMTVMPRGDGRAAVTSVTSVSVTHTKLTQYIYDGNTDKPIYKITPDGRVTNFAYNSYGDLQTETHYSERFYPIDNAMPPYTVADVNAWLDAPWLTHDLAQTSRTDYTYDGRGLLATTTTYPQLDGQGQPAAGVPGSTNHFIYDQSGQLLQSIDANGNPTLFTYDGLGRVLSTTDAKQNSTITTYDDVNNAITAHMSNGLSRVSAYDKAGQLISVNELDANVPLLGKTSYTYDGAGLLRVTQNPIGERIYMYYDVAGYLKATIDANGSVVEYTRNLAHQVVNTTAYAAQLTRAQLDGLVTSDSDNVLQNFDSVRPTSMASQNRTIVNRYDTSGRLIESVDGNFNLTRYAYNTVGQLLTTTWLATPLGFDSPASADDRTSYNFYDDDGYLTGTLDPEGYLTQYQFDGHGRRTGSTSYATPIAPELRDVGTIENLHAEPSAKDIVHHFIYDDAGRQVGSIDGEGYLTESFYDLQGNVIATALYADRVAFTEGATVETLRPGYASIADRSHTYTYTSLNQLDTETWPDGSTVTKYEYDAVGAVTATTVAIGTPSASGTRMRYDTQGRMTAMLSAEGVSKLPADPNDAAGIEAIWAGYSTKYTYDAAGERTSMTDALGNRSVYYYDEVGRPVYTINALGEVSEQHYNAFGQVDAMTWHAAHLGGVATLAGGRVTPDVKAQIDAIASPADSVQTFAYDNDGQVVDVADALHFHTLSTYNAFGETTQTVQVAQAGSIDPAAPANVITRTIYDKDGRVAATVDAVGDVASYRYDELGNVLERIAYARAIEPTSTVEQVKAAIAEGTLNDAVRDSHQVFVYDLRGQLTASYTAIDGNAGAWSAATRSYDASGNLIATDAYATPVFGSADSLPSVFVHGAADASVRYAYDKEDRPVLVATAINTGADGVAKWTIARNQYDAIGNLVATTTFAEALTGANPVNDVQAQNFIEAHDADPRNETTRFAYDSSRRVTVKAVAQDSANWAVTRYVYDKVGNLIETIAGANPALSLAPFAIGGATPAEVAAAVTARFAAWLDAGAPAGAADRVTRFGYDSANRLINTLDAVDALTSRTYDAKGNVVAVTAYAAPLHLSGQLPRDFYVAADPALDRVTRTIYDLDNRPSLQIDALGGASLRQYDAFGNVVAVTRYATPLSNGATVPQADAVHDRTERYVYDKAQRQVFSIDAAGFVIETSYDALDRTSATIEYANAYGGAADLASLIDARPALGLSRVNSYSYDARGLTIEHRDPTGAEEYFTYDGLGNQVSSTNKNGQPTYYDYDGVGRMVRQYTPAYFAWQDVDGQPTALLTTLDNVFEYDPLGNLYARIENAGGRQRVTTYAYDLVGRQTGTTLPPAAVYDKFSDPIASADNTRYETQQTVGSTTAVVYDVFGDAVASTDALGNISRKVYDQLGRETADIDALGYVTLKQYDSFGDTVRITRTAASLLPPLSQLQAVQLYELILGRPPEDPESIGSQLRIGESFAHVADAIFGSPEATGNLYPAGMSPQAFVTQLFNVAVGRAPLENELARYVGLLDAGASQGTVADLMIHGLDNAADLSVWNAKMEAAFPTAVAAVRVKVTQLYEAILGRGPSNAELIEGALTLVGLSMAELADRLFATPEGRARYANARPVDTLYQGMVGHPAGDQYDTVAAMYAADPGTAAVYAIEHVAAANDADTAYLAAAVARDLIPQSIIGIGAGQLDLAGAAALLAGLTNADNRTIVQSFDKLGRVLTVAETSGLFSMVTNVGGVSQYGIVQGHKQTTSTYDSFGDLLSQTVGVHDDATGALLADPATSRFAYNLRGEQIAQFVLANTRQLLEGENLASAANPGASGAVAGLNEDIGGYLTTMAYDAAGNLTRVTEFARLIDPAALLVDGKLDPALFAGAVPLTASDRETDYAYDLQNNRMTEVHRMADVNQVSLQGAQTMPVDVATEYKHDAMGNLTAVIDQLGGATYSYYDSKGQVIAVASSIDGDLFTLTTFDRDGFGNVVRRIDHANGARGVSEAGWTPVGADPEHDRVTLTQYDNNGRAIVETDAEGHTLFTSYDALGRIAKQWQPVDLVRLKSIFTTDIGTVFKVMTYDQVGQLVALNRSGAALDGLSNEVTIARSNTRFNGFGEVVEQIVDGATTEVARYDAQGRIWMTNADDGVYKALFYNVQGQVATVMRTDVTENVLGSLSTLHSALEVAQSPQHFIRTDTMYDLMGRIVRVDSPGSVDNLAPGQVASRSNVYQRNDRWGNLVERTDPRNPNWSTTYTYNWRNLLIEEDNVVKSSGEGGPSERTDKAVTTFYDALGRQIGMRDGNMNAAGTGQLTTTMSYDLQGRMTAEYHADGGLIVSQYNLFGDRTLMSVQINEAQSEVTSYAYDHLSHLIDAWTAPVETWYLATPLDSGGMGFSYGGMNALHLHYDYDSRGLRYQTINSDGGATRSRYDLDGNLVGTSDPVGITTLYRYDNMHNRIGQLNGDGRSMSWQYDLHHKVLSHVDLGGATVNYAYDGRNQLVAQTSSPRGGTGLSQDIVSTYDEAGMLTKVNDRTSGTVTTYAYDLAGNRTAERTLASANAATGAQPNGPQSPERTFVTKLYFALLNRAPEQEGLDTWTGRLHNGESYEQVANEILISVETENYFPPYASGSDFATTLYQFALNRAPTEAERSAIADPIDNGWSSRGQVVIDFINGISGQADQAYFNGRVDSALFTPASPGSADYGIIAQNNTNTYDNLGRLTDVVDGRYTVGFRYDANGNRTYVHTHYTDPEGAVDTNAINTFDPMNRQLIVNGTVDENGSVVIGQYGHSLTYDLAGKRATDTYLADPNNPGSMTTESFVYDQAGRLTETYRTVAGTGTAYVTNYRRYDSGSRIVQTGVGFGLNSDTENALKGMKIDLSTREIAYDKAGKVQRQKSYSATVSGEDGKLDDIYYYAAPDRSAYQNELLGYDDAGNLKGYYVVPHAAGVSDQYLYHTDYAYFDGYVQAKTTVIRGNGNSSDAEHYKETVNTYNQNGFLVKVQEGSNTPRTFINDAEGRILMATSGSEVTTSLIVNGEVFGSSGGPRGEQIPGYFATTYESVTASSVAAAPTVYVVIGGETLQSIAKGIWGDARLWYLIADANGLSGAETLTAGQQITIPARVNTVTSNYQAYKPYDPSKLIGDTTPTLPQPTGGGGGCGPIGQILGIAIAVAAFYFLGPQGLSVAANLGLSGAAAAAATGALASIVSQGIGVAIGLQDRFSWSSVGLAAIGAGVTQGLDGPFAGAKFLGLEGTGAVVARAAVGNALTQGISVAVGLQKSFNWKGVLASAASSYLNEQILDRLNAGGMIDQSNVRGVRAGVLAVSNAANQVLQGGKITALGIVTDAFGTALGSGFAAYVMNGQAATKTVTPVSGVADAGNGDIGPILSSAVASGAGAVASIYSDSTASWPSEEFGTNPKGRGVRFFVGGPPVVSEESSVPFMQNFVNVIGVSKFVDGMPVVEIPRPMVAVATSSAGDAQAQRDELVRLALNFEVATDNRANSVIPDSRFARLGQLPLNYVNQIGQQARTRGDRVVNNTLNRAQINGAAIPNLRNPAAAAQGHQVPIIMSPARRSDISAHSMQVLNGISVAAGTDVRQMRITSTTRTSQDQARIMFSQLQNGTLSRYGTAGQAVVRVYRQGRANGDSPDQIRTAMTDRIQQFFDQGVRVSNHMADLGTLNVFDIAPSSIPPNQRRAFEAALDSAKRSGQISVYHGPNTPARDPAYHLEILQPRQH